MMQYNNHMTNTSTDSKEKHVKANNEQECLHLGNADTSKEAATNPRQNYNNMIWECSL